VKLFWNELKYFINQIRSGYLRQVIENDYSIKIRRVRSLELLRYSLGECYLAADSIRPKHSENVAKIAWTFYSRSERGKATLDDAVKCYEGRR